MKLVSRVKAGKFGAYIHRWPKINLRFMLNAFLVVVLRCFCDCSMLNWIFDGFSSFGFNMREYDGEEHNEFLRLRSFDCLHI